MIYLIKYTPSDIEWNCGYCEKSEDSNFDIFFYDDEDDSSNHLADVLAGWMREYDNYQRSEITIIKGTRVFLSSGNYFSPGYEPDEEFKGIYEQALIKIKEKEIRVEQERLKKMEEQTKKNNAIQIEEELKQLAKLAAKYKLTISKAEEGC